MALEVARLARHERAVGHEAIVRVAHEGEAEVRIEGIGAQHRADLARGEVAVADRGERRVRQPLVDEQADLLLVLRPHLRAQRLAHGMGAGLGHGEEDEAVAVRDDHGKRGPLRRA